MGVSTSLPAGQQPSQISTCFRQKMLKYFLFVLIPTLSLGLSVDKIDKLIEDRVQNTELDGDNVDFPTLVDDLEEESEAASAEDKDDGINVTNEIVNKEIAASTSKLVDFVQKYFAAQKKPTEKIWSFGNTNNNNWSFWKNFVKPHLGDLSYMNNLKHLSHLSHLSHFSNFNNNGNWWNTNWNTNTKSKQDSPAEESMLTIYHKMTVDNHTREGVTKVPSSELMPFMRTVWNSLSRDSHMALGIGAFLPFLGIILPFVIMAAVIPIIFFIMLFFWNDEWNPCSSASHADRS